MANNPDLCKYADICEAYQGTHPALDLPQHFIHRIYCTSGQTGWNICTLYQLREKKVEPPDYIKPNSTKEIDKIIEDMSKK